jgi:hypothetical protein
MISKNSVLPLPVRLIIILVFAALLISGMPVKAAEITLAWDSNAEPDLSGYKVFSGTASRSYSGSVDVGNWTSCVMGGLEPGKTYYFAAKAYNATGSESDYSTEVAYNVPAACSFSLSPGSQSYAASGGTGLHGDSGGLRGVLLDHLLGRFGRYDIACGYIRRHERREQDVRHKPEIRLRHLVRAGRRGQRWCRLLLHLQRGQGEPLHQGPLQEKVFLALVVRMQPASRPQ